MRNIAISLLLLIVSSVCVVQTINAQKKPKRERAKKYYNLVYESGNKESGYVYNVYEKKNEYDDYAYLIVQGHMINSKLNGFGCSLSFSVPDRQRLDFDNNVFDSAEAINTINMLPYFEGKSGKETSKMKVYYYHYYCGLFHDDEIVRGKYFNSQGSIKFEGIFGGYNGKLFEYGTYSDQSRDTVYRGFMKKLDHYMGYYSLSNIGLRFYTVDTFFKMTSNVVSTVDYKPSIDFPPYPMSEYNPQRKPVINMPFNNGTYNGEAFNNKPEGLGEWISDNGEFVGFGFFKNGFPHGVYCTNYQKRHSNAKLLYSNNRPWKGLSVCGLFSNGTPIKVYIDEGDWYYGEVNEDLEPHGIGERRVNGVVEKGRFAYGELDGWGTRIDQNKNVTTGNFIHGSIASGTVRKSVYSLNQYDVIIFRGKKMIVLEKKWTSEGKSYAILNNGVTLYEGDDFVLSTGDDNEFYRSCTKCNGAGYVYTTSTFQVYTGYETVEHKTVERIGGKDYIKSSVEFIPKYTEKSNTSKQTCGLCNGKGRYIIRN